MLAYGVVTCSSCSSIQIPPSGSPNNRRTIEPCTAQYRHRQWRRCKSVHVVGRKMIRPAAAARAVGPSSDQSSPEKPPPEDPADKGTVLGAVSLIVGTSIGSGILALPQKTSPAGFIPSAACIILCWVFLVVEALLLAEVNTDLRKKRKKDGGGKGANLEVLSLRTMAQETLGDWGGNLATVTYLFLSYAFVVAYTSKSGEVLSHLTGLPSSILGNLFTLLLGMLMLVGGTTITDQVNQWLTVTMIGLLVMIEFITVSYGDGSVSLISNWEKAPQTIPVIIFSLVYHDIAPVVCAYLGGDLKRIRFSILLGSIVPLISLLVWEGIVLGISSSSDGNGPLELPMSMSVMVETFSILAVGTSLIGTLLGFSQFFGEQLVNLYDSKQEEDPKIGDSGTRDQAEENKARNWWEKNKPPLLATAIVIFPSMFISSLVPDAFSVATDVAGGYCMIVLYGILPPAMAWVRASTAEKDRDDKDAEGMLFRAMPVLVGAGLFSCAVIVEQVAQDLNTSLFKLIYLY